MESILRVQVKPSVNEGSLPQRCLRVTQLVAFGWLLLGNGLTLSTTDSTTRLGHRLHLAGGSALLISVCLFSLLLPLNYVINRYEREREQSQA